MHDEKRTIWVVYDLRDAQQWEQAGRDRRAWGHEMTEIHRLDNDHFIIEFRSDELKASA